MKKIVVTYWNGIKFNGLNIDQNSSFEYSAEQLFELVEYFTSHNYQIMVVPDSSIKAMRLYVDDLHFRQR